MKHLATSIVSLALIASAPVRTETTGGPKPMRMVKDVRAVAPALEKYAQGVVLGGLWKRPGLFPRGRSIVTVAALIAQSNGRPTDYVRLAAGAEPWIVPIPNTRRVDRLDENLGPASVLLTSDDLLEIDQAVEGARYPEDLMSAKMARGIGR